MQTFLDTLWGTTHFHVQRSRADYFNRLMEGASLVEDLVEHVRPEPSAVRLVKGGADKDPDSYRLADGGLDVAGVRDGFSDGYTIVLNGLERYVRAIASLSHSIEVELNFPTRVNAYVTPPESTGFIPHYDPHDVLILQVQGSKIWRLSDGADVAPHEMLRREGVTAAGQPLPIHVRMEAGDVLYVPRGRTHAAETALEPSIHLTVGIHAPTVLTLVSHMLHSLSLRDDRLHALLPPRHLDDAAVRAGLGAVVSDIVRTVEAPSAIAAGLGALEDVLVKRGRCPPVGPASNAVGIDGQTRVVKYQPLYSRVVPAVDGVALQFAQLSISVGPDHQAAMLFLSGSTGPFRVSELPGLREAQQQELARTLIVSGFLVRLPND